MNKGCDLLESQLEGLVYLIASAQDARGRARDAALNSSPTRSRSRPVLAAAEDLTGAADAPGRWQAQAVLAEWQERLAQEKEQLAEAIQSLSASVNNVRPPGRGVACSTELLLAAA